MNLRRLLDRWLACPFDPESVQQVTTSTSPSPTLKVRAPTFLHRWWRKQQFARARKEAQAKGEHFDGNEWDDWLWVSRVPVNASQRALAAEWSVEAQQDWVQAAGEQTVRR